MSCRDVSFHNLSELSLPDSLESGVKCLILVASLGIRLFVVLLDEELNA